MSNNNNNDLSLSSASRRSFLSLSAAASAALAFRTVTEPMLAHASVHNVPKDAIRIDANENPLGPSTSAREAASAIVSQLVRRCIRCGGASHCDRTDARSRPRAQFSKGRDPD